jgi:lipoprotein-anchoring transpeptidase ErfK/SrfK
VTCPAACGSSRLTRSFSRPFGRSSAVAGLSLLVLALAPVDPALARFRRTEPAAPAATGSLAGLPDKPRGTVILAVSLAEQRLTIWEDGVVVGRSMVSTGVAGHETPRGVFTVLQKKRMHRSNIYSNAPMPFMQRITWSGVALHQGHVTGRPASHGCIRLAPANAAKLFRIVQLEGALITIHDAASRAKDQEKLAQSLALAPLRKDDPGEAQSGDWSLRRPAD